MRQVCDESQFLSTGFRLLAPAHNGIRVVADFYDSDNGTWFGRQSWNRGAGGLRTYNFTYDPKPPTSWQVRVRVFDTAGARLYETRRPLRECPLNTTPPPGTPPATIVIPITDNGGFDLPGQADFMGQLLQNLSLGFLGLGLLMHGLTLRTAREERQV
jgi:hypothetical protein